MDNGVKAELTATERVALHRYTYPSGSEHRLLINLKEGIGDKAYDTYLKKIDEYTIEGYRFSKGWSPRHKVFFTLKCDQPIESLAVFNDDEAAGNDELTGESVKGVITFKGDSPTALVKVAISSVSCENAWLTYVRSFLIGISTRFVTRLSINGMINYLVSPSIRKMSVPRRFSIPPCTMRLSLRHCIATRMAISVAMTIRCIRTILGRTIPLSLYGIRYRTLHPLFTIIKPQYVSDLVNSMLSIYDQQEKLPIWPLIGGETDQMPDIALCLLSRMPI